MNTAIKLQVSASAPQPHFGISNLNDILYLFQDTTPDGAPLLEFDDRANVSSCRNTDLAGIGGACTHNINPFAMYRKVPKNQWQRFLSIVTDPLTELFLPVPAEAKRFHSNVFVLDYGFSSSWYFLLKNLERLCSPVHSKVDPLVWGQVNKVLSDITLSNIQPLVLTLNTDAPLPLDLIAPIIEKAQASALRRPVLFVATKRNVAEIKNLFPSVEEIKTTLVGSSLTTNLISTPMENIGSRVLGFYSINKTLEF